MRGVLTRWLLVATAVALVLLGRPTEQSCAHRSDDQVSLGATDDITLQSARRHLPVLRLAPVDHDDTWSIELARSWTNDVLVAFKSSLVDVTGRSPTPIEHVSALWARGPPVLPA